MSFVGGLLRHHLADTQIIRQRLPSIPLSDERRDACLARLQRLS